MIGGWRMIGAALIGGHLMTENILAHYWVVCAGNFVDLGWTGHIGVTIRYRAFITAV